MTDVVDFPGKPKRPAGGAPGGMRPVDHTASIRAYRPNDELFGLKPGQWEEQADRLGMPPHCPVRPLGRDGDTFWFINASGELATLTPSASNKRHLLALFAPQTRYLTWAWPRWDKKAKKFVDNFEADQAAESLFNACAHAGSWNATDAVRGRGAWRGPDGDVVLHLGDKILYGDRVLTPGEHHGYVYPARPPIAPPTAPGTAPDGPDGTGAQLLRILETWNWKRPNLDPFLMLGWLAQAPVGGALSWRSHVFLTGGFGTGKSTLQAMLGHTCAGGIVQPADTTAAGIYQKVRQDSLPVAVDESEGDADNRKLLAVVRLARVAASGGKLLRGGSDHDGVEFTVRQAFLFSSINPPPLAEQDRSRMALLELAPLVNVAAGAVLDVPALQVLGRELLRRMLDWWPRLVDMPGGKESLLGVFRRALIEAGHTSRSADTFGTLAAFAHAALFDDMPEPAQIDEWIARLAVDGMHEIAGQTENWRACLQHLLSAQPDAWRNLSARSVYDVLERLKHGSEDFGFAAARKQLAQIGVGLNQINGSVAWKDLELFVPRTHVALTELYRGSQWTGVPGLPGVWSDALAQAPLDLVRRGKGRVGPYDGRGAFVAIGKWWIEREAEGA